MESKIIKVIIDIKDKSLTVGTLYVDVVRNKEVHSFSFDEDYLKSKQLLIFDSELSYSNNRQYCNSPDKTFNFIKDATPDRWGKSLINKYYQNLATNPRSLGESDYLLSLNDETRIGALRFEIIKGEPIFKNVKRKIPTLLNINELYHLADISYDINEINNQELEMILEPGSSLGGARPKASVYDARGNLYLAKFPKNDDDYDVGLWEYVTNELARLCKINVPETKLIPLPKHGSAFLSKRFDRDGKYKIPYVSLMCLLSAEDGDSDKYSYLDFAEIISTFSYQPKEDLKELFRRIAFNIIIHNGDDHLRNHGFIYRDMGWTLSPAFDINISLNKNNLSLKVDENSSEFNLDLLIKTSESYGLNKDDAGKTVEEIKNIIRRNLPIIAKKCHAKEGEIKNFFKIVQ